MNKNVKPAVIGMATTLVLPMTSLAYDQVSNNEDNSVLESSNLSRAITTLDKAGVVTGVASNDYLNVRSSANTSSSVIGKLANGETIIITGKDGEWYRVDCNGKTGYVYEKYIRVTGDITYKKTTDNLNMRWGPSTSNGIITNIPKGTTVKVISTSNGWDKVYYSGEIGFCSNSYLVATSPTSPTSGNSSSSSSITTMNKEGQVTGVAGNDTLNVRSEANADSSIVTKLSNGTKVQVIGQDTKTKWYKITCNGKTGYVNNKYIKIVGDWNSSITNNSSITSMNKEGQVTGIASNDTLNMRSEANTTSSILAKLPNGTKVQVIGQDTKTKWYKINYNGKTGYVSNSYIKINGDWNSSSSSITGTRKTTDNLNFRTGPGTNYSIIATIPNGTVVDYYSESNGWAKIRYNGKDGYVSASYLTTNTSSTTNTVKKITTANVNMRTGASTSHSIIKTVASNTVVEVISSSGSWDKVKVGGDTGYINNSYLKNYDGTSNSGSSNLPSSKPLYSKVKVVIDAGHGGTDPGAVANGRQEKDIVLSISKKVNNKLKSLGFQTIMTRSTDTYVTLSNRYTIANNNKADLFVSVHANSGASSASGIETLYKNYKTLADNIQTSIINETGAKSRGLKYRTDLAVLNGTKMPSALVEVGFISNATESSKIGSDSYQEKLATGIVKGITKYTDKNISK